MYFPTGFFQLVAAGVTIGMSLAQVEAAVVQSDHLALELVSESATLAPGETAWLGLVLRHDAHWHSYWTNPGDSGLPTRLSWTLPPGFTVDQIAWPAPTRFEVGGLYNFGYADEQLLPIAVHVPATAVPGETVALSVEVKWLVCREECIPGKATLDIELPIAKDDASGRGMHHDLFTAARDATPIATPWTGSARLAGERIAIEIDGAGLPSTEGLDVFAVERRILDNAPASLRRDGDKLLIDVARNDYFDKSPAALDLVLTRTMTNGRAVAWQVRVPFLVEPSTK